MRDAVAAQAALLAGGALGGEVMGQLARDRPAVGQRYLALELGRVAVQLQHTMPTRTLRRLTSALPHPVSASSEESLRRARSREQLPSPPAWAGTLRASRLRRSGAADAGSPPTPGDLARAEQLPELAPDEGSEGEESKILRLMSAPGIVNPFADALRKLLGLRPGAPDKPDKQRGSGEIAVAMQRAVPVGRHARRGALDRWLSVVAGSPPEHGRTYPEWDCHKGRYRPAWCTVVEYDPELAESPTVAAGVSGRSFQRPLARVGIEAQRHRRQADGDCLDLSALVDYETDRRHGDNPDPYIYESSRLTKRELSVLVLLDCSGSTAEDAGGHVVFEEERRLAGDLTAALERLGDRVGTYGFYSRGKDAVRFLRIKDFDGRFNAAAKRRLGSVHPSGFTRMGAAIRHAAHVLESQALAKNMMLLVVGDGLPYDDGYEDRYARADTRRAIGDCVVRGIGVAGIGIRSSTEPHVLEDVWSDASFRVIGHSDDIRRHLHALSQGALSMTRSNGRRRDLLTEQHHAQLRSHTARHSATNTYI